MSGQRGRSRGRSGARNRSRPAHGEHHSALSQTQTQTWIQPQSCSVNPNFDHPAVQHKAEVLLVFLAYKRVLMDGVYTSLIQIALAVTQALGNDEAVDGVQPMWAGWCIYIRTQADHNEARDVETLVITTLILGVMLIHHWIFKVL